MHLIISPKLGILSLSRRVDFYHIGIVISGSFHEIDDVSYLLGVNSLMTSFNNFTCCGIDGYLAEE
ncbi:MAG: hypothetical protein IPH20_21275 [Bacteroidales bacterium]|nr:hypothetical protein [Bacteroidales bacterium]